MKRLWWLLSFQSLISNYAARNYKYFLKLCNYPVRHLCKYTEKYTIYSVFEVLSFGLLLCHENDDDFTVPVIQGQKRAAIFILFLLLLALSL